MSRFRLFTTLSTLAFGALPMLAMPAPALAQSAPVISKHVIQAGASSLAYQAEVDETLLRDAKGNAVVTANATAYTLDGVSDETARPVVFLFNGGPGASSSPLQSAFGPRVADGKGGMADNATTLLNSADLVFIDPPGTGLSHVSNPDELGLFLGPDHDATAALTVIKAWLAAHHREASPLYIAGESYGGMRLALIAGQVAADKSLPNLKGLIFISPALNMAESPVITQMLEVTTEAAGAWYYQKVDRHGKTLEAFVADARRFAVDTYAPVLLKGPAATDDEKHRVAQQLSAIIGLPADEIEKANLRLDSETFLAELNADKNLETGRLDMRVSAPKKPPADPSRPAAANDPALGLGASNVIRSKALTDYFRDELKVPVTGDYVSLSLELNFKWNWGDVTGDKRFGLDAAPDVARLLKARPGVRALVVGGYYDLAVPVDGPRFELEQADVPPAQVRFLAFPTGHTVFNRADDIAGKTDLVRTFINPQTH